MREMRIEVECTVIGLLQSTNLEIGGIDDGLELTSR